MRDAIDRFCAFHLAAGNCPNYTIGQTGRAIYAAIFVETEFHGKTLVGASGVATHWLLWL